MSDQPKRPRPFLCRPSWADDGHPWATVYAFTRSKARYQYFLDISDCCPDLKIHQITVRAGAGWRDTEKFLRTATYRRRSDLHVGSRVRVGNNLGWVVDSNSSANFDVLFDEDSEYAGAKMNCHPHYIELVSSPIQDGDRLEDYLDGKYATGNPISGCSSTG